MILGPGVGVRGKTGGGDVHHPLDDVAAPDTAQVRDHCVGRSVEKVVDRSGRVDRGDDTAGRDSLPAGGAHRNDPAGGGLDRDDRLRAAHLAVEGLETTDQGVGEGLSTAERMPLAEEMVGGLPEAVDGAAGVVRPDRAVRSERRDRGPGQVGGKTPDQERAVRAEQVPSSTAG